MLEDGREMRRNEQHFLQGTCKTIRPASGYSSLSRWRRRRFQIPLSRGLWFKPDSDCAQKWCLSPDVASSNTTDLSNTTGSIVQNSFVEQQHSSTSGRKHQHAWSVKTSERSSSIATAFHFINTFNIKHTRSFIVMTKTTKRRICRIDGCDKIVKSQGLCQRHGAKTRMCKMENCSKQAQGNFDGMCKVSLSLQ